MRSIGRPKFAESPSLRSGVTCAVVTGIIGWLCTVSILHLATLAMGPDVADGFSGRGREIDATLILAAIVIGPVGESLLVWLSIWFFETRARLEPVATTIATGLTLTAMHGIGVASLAVTPTFFMHAAIIHSARRSGHAGRGWLTIAGAHAIQNLISVVRPLLFA